ncbi:MAG: aminopeptidase [Opitutae bacterium]|nr:aminopeptidase [Opitutae bacterium]
MLPAFPAQLRAFAGVIVRVGLNLQRGQRLLIAEPYELQGVARSAEVIVDAVRAAATEAGCPAVEVIWGDGGRLRQYAEKNDWRGFTSLVAGNARQMQQHLARGGAFLFLVGSQPRLLDGIEAARVNELQHLVWQHFGPVVQRLMRGESQWTIAPAPSPDWAQAVFAEQPSERRLDALWQTLFSACRCDQPDPVEAWHRHLGALASDADRRNAQRAATLRYTGPGTDLTVRLPKRHVWCTAAHRTKAGVPFVQNLPTEEIFTAPDKDSAEGLVRVAQPVSCGGALIDDIELEFRRGRVVQAAAKSGADLLQRLLETDDGAARLGEVALLPRSGATRAAWQRSGRSFRHPLLDENSAPHIALGESYGFCLDSFFTGARNRSLIHVDLPLDALVSTEPA